MAVIGQNQGTWREKLIPVPQRPPKIPHGLVWVQPKPLQWHKWATSCLSHDTASVQLWGCVRFEVLTAVLLRIQAFCDVTKSRWISGSWPIKRPSWPHLYRSRRSWRWRHHDPFKCQDPHDPHSNTSHTTCNLDYEAVYSLLSWLLPVHYTTNITVFLTMHHHWRVLLCSLANGNQFKDPLTETFITYCHPITTLTSVTWLQTHMPVWAAPFQTVLMLINC
jgi:hypothetical protein